MVLKNGFMYKNIEVLSYSRLSTGQSGTDCMKKCRINQECYSFNYNKLNKWCYLGLTEESELLLAKNGKWTVGYRECVEHTDSSAWGSDQYSSGTGVAPDPVSNLNVADSSATSNVLTISFIAPATAGTTSEGTNSTIMTYKITCTPSIPTSSIRPVTKSCSPLEASCIGDTFCTVQFTGLSLVDYRCSVIAVNAALIQSAAVVSSPTKVCDLGLIGCNGSCLNGQADSSNCGTCGNVCTGDKFCSVGVCKCPTGQTDCGGVCKTLLTDFNNCGICGNICPTGASCNTGVCTCPADQAVCNGACQSFQFDASNCGACGNTCGTGGSCNAGVCTCGAGYYLSGNTCLPCDPSCATCSGGAYNQCIMCAAGGVPDSTTEACPCVTGYYWSAQYSRCVQNNINPCSVNDCKVYDAITNTCPTNKADGTACSSNGGSTCINGYCAYRCSFYTDCPNKHTTTGTCSTISGQTVCDYGDICVSGWTNINGVSTDGCEYQQSTGISGLTVWQNCQQTGWTFDLQLGAYNMDPNTQADASYIRVPAGYRVKLYKGEDLTCGSYPACNCPLVVGGGTSLSFCTSGANPCGAGGYNDQVRSVLVEKV